MSNNQRKDIIKQIKDLSKSRKSVYIADLNAQGIYFDEDLPEDIGEGQESLIKWTRVTYYQDNTGFPTEAMFMDINNLISPSISTNEILSVSGLSDVNVTYQSNIKYATIIKTQKTLNSFLTFSGKCSASVYLNGSIVIRHTYNPDIPSSLTTRSPINIPFNREDEQKIVIYIYGHLNNANTAATSLSGDVFSFIEYSRVEDVPKPLSVFATDNLINSVKVSWAQTEGSIGPGGGVEIWSKQEEVDNDYRLLSRVPYPTDFFLHTEQIGGSGLLKNSGLQYYNFDGEDTTNLGVILSDSMPTDGTGLVYWGVNTLAQSGNHGNFTVVSSILADQTFALDYRYTTHKEFDYDNIVASNLKYPAESDNLFTEDPIVFDYAGTYYIKLDKNFTPLTGAPLDGLITFTWDYDPAATDSQVQCIIYKNGTPTTITVDATLGSYDYELGFDAYTYSQNTAYIDVEFKTSAALANSDPTSTKVYFHSVELAFIYSNDPQSDIKSDIFPCVNEDEISFDLLISTEGIPPEINAYCRYYDEDGVPVSVDSFTDTRFTKTIEGSFTRYTVSHTVPYWAEGSNLIKSGDVVYIFKSIADKGSFILQKADIIKRSTKTLPGGTIYTYKLRNYTPTYSFSEFTDPVIGQTGRNIYFLSMESENDQISAYKSTKIGIQSTTPLSYLDVETIPPQGEYVVPLQLVSLNENLADYTYEFRPLLSNCIVYDTFENDQWLSENPEVSHNILNETESYDNSPPKLPSVWGVESDTYPYLFVNNAFSFWGGQQGQGYRNSAYVAFVNYSDEKYKRYYLDYIQPFYRGIFGNALTGQLVNQKSPENYNKFSLGMICRIHQHSQTFGENSRIARSNQVFTFHVYPHSADTVQLVLALRGDTYNWLNPDNGDVILNHTIPVSPRADDWYYIHASADAQAVNDPNRTYISVHKVSTDTDATVVNEVTEVLLNNSSIHKWNWEFAGTVDLGFSSTSAGAGDFCTFYCDTFYVTADIIERQVIDEVVAPALYEGRNPFYATYGYSSGESFRVTAAGLPITAAREDGNEGSVPEDADILRSELTLTADWDAGDGTAYIVREAFTLNQDEIDQLTELQPGHTYSRVNKIIPNFTAPNSPITHIRFSNDKEQWSTWRRFTNGLMYPWELTEVGGHGWDTEEGGIREVFTQVITDVGISSDYVLKANHRDTIIYNPVGSIGGIESWNYVKGATGWSIDLGGEAEFNDIFIRGRSVFGGKVLNHVKMREHNIGSQLGPEFFNVETTLPPTPLSSGVQFNLEHMVSTFSTYSNVDYNSDIVVDMYDNNKVYIPANIGNSFRCYRFNTKTKLLEAFVDLGPKMVSEAPYAQAHVALSKDYVYVGAGRTVRKYLKTDFVTNNYVAELGEATIQKCIQGIRLAYLEDYDFSKIYIAAQNTHGPNANDQLWFYVAFAESQYGDGFQYPSTHQAYMPAANAPQFTSKCWDCNGKYLVFINYSYTASKIYCYPLNSSGGINASALYDWMQETQTGVIDLDVMTAADNVLMNQVDWVQDFAYEYNRPPRYFRQPSGVRLFDEIYMFYPTPGNFPYDYNLASPTVPYNLIGTADCVRDTTTTGVTSLLYLSNYPAPEFGHVASQGENWEGYLMAPAWTVSNPQEQSGSDFPLRSITILSHVYNTFGPYEDNYNRSITPTPESGFGFTTPIVVGDKIQIGHSASSRTNYKSSVYGFAFDGRSLSFNNPDIHTQYSNYCMCSMFYDGQNHYKLMRKLTKVVGSWQDNLLSITKH